jgi:hypothetical protein
MEPERNFCRCGEALFRRAATRSLRRTVDSALAAFVTCFSIALVEIL